MLPPVSSDDPATEIFQKLLAEYYIDLEGRQYLGHIVLELCHVGQYLERVVLELLAEYYSVLAEYYIDLEGRQ